MEKETYTRQETYKKIELSKRLGCVAGMVTRAGTVADIGCDHGFVSIYLMQNHLAGHVLAMDVNQGPLTRAKEHISGYGLEDVIETRLSDGMAALTREDAVDTVILAGMGGRLMERILLAALQRELVIPELILQPQSEWLDFRRFLRTHEYYIVGEDMVLEENKFYPVLKAKHRSAATKEQIEFINSPMTQQAMADRDFTDKDAQKLCDSFGPYLLNEKHPVLGQYMEKELGKYDALIAGLSDEQKQRTTMIEKRQLLQQAKEIFYAV